jgi:hypothetical protein
MYGDLGGSIAGAAPPRRGEASRHASRAIRRLQRYAAAEHRPTRGVMVRTHSHPSFHGCDRDCPELDHQAEPMIACIGDPIFSARWY